MGSPIFMWLLASEKPPPTKGLCPNLIVLGPNCKNQNADVIFLGKDNFDEDDYDYKYLMAVEHELCIVYPEQSLRAPLAGQPT